MKATFVLLLLAVVTLGGCAHVVDDVHATYALPQTNAGSVSVVLNQETSALSVTVDGQLVVDRKHARRAQVDGIPAGTTHVTVATGGGCEAGALTEHELEVQPGVVTTLTLPGPEPNLGCSTFAGLHLVATELGLVAVVLAFALL